jgi:diphthamide biosynthesis methyltransferase
MISDKTMMALEDCLEQLLALQTPNEQRAYMEKKIVYIASLPPNEQRAWLAKLQAHIRQDFDEIKRVFS